MAALIVKVLLTAVIVVAVSELGKRSTLAGALLASLPLTSLLAIIWLWRDSHDPERVAELTASAFWFILPSLPMFLVLPALLRTGVTFWLAMALSVVGTLMLYALWFWIAPRAGIKL